ncbi:MAG: acetoacetate--CoA ligase, partial [Gammaproteobacteria bacterium]|nr:acetoacetate--CoA ligase [Gammaproteobacteria bacterium]
MPQPLWQPSQAVIDSSNLTAFRRSAEYLGGVPLPDYAALHTWSLEEPEMFWRLLWKQAGVVGDTGRDPFVIDENRMPGAQWFPEARLNFAENLLAPGDDADEALVFHGESQPVRRMTRGQLRAAVSQFAQALGALGIQPGDRVVGYMPNMPETLVAMLAATSLGAIWSSCSPDFGARGVLDRFGQIEPKLLIAVDGYFYGGKAHSLQQKLAEVVAELPTLERVVVVPVLEPKPDLTKIPGAELLADFIAPWSPGKLSFERLPFDHPLYILYSSGTTGVPKCIVHGAGGTLLQHLKEHLLQTDIKPGERLFYFTTCGWMMWNWLVSGLAAGATLVLYDGSPFYPDGNVLFDLVDEEQIAVFGTSAKYIDALNKAGVTPAKTHDLSSLKTILSTGSPLVPESFDFVYESIKADLCLSSIAGGTDIVSCFIAGAPTLPVWRGELQCAALGMAVQIWNDAAESVVGQKGELVCLQPFPSMPIGFWNDPDGSRYHAAYFERFPGVWCHGDYAEVTDHGGYIIYGRSDSVLNPGGVRIGTAEIYRQVEQLDEVVESLVIGQPWQGDVRVVLFVHLRDGVELTDELVTRIRQRVRENTTPRHVPAKILQVPDIPRTRSGKIVELAVRNLVIGEAVRNREALANPEA